MKILRKIKRIIIGNIRHVLFGKHQPGRTLYLVVPKTGHDNIQEKVEEIKKRIRFYETQLKIEVIDRLPFVKRFDYSLVGFVSWNRSPGKYFLSRIKHEQIYNFDFDTHVGEGWEYHRLLSNLNANETIEGIKKGRERLIMLRSELHDKIQKVYIFGTGPSLEKARDMDWSDGMRIVCNTIVKDHAIWNHLQPKFIVAADAIYHFGFSEFSKKFRDDLAKRLRESPDTRFVFPAYFYPFCLRHLSEFEERMIPIPVGNRKDIYTSLTESFVLPSVGNVLPSMLLPLACTFSQNIYLWGFDGRASGDTLFWKNSGKHFYIDDVAQLRKLHPAFFNVLVPQGREDEYVKRVHGEDLENQLSKAEEKGFHFHMMHFSNTPVLQKRNR